MLNEEKFTKVKRKMALRRAVQNYRNTVLNPIKWIVVFITILILRMILKLYWFSILTGIIIAQILLIYMYYGECTEEVEDEDVKHREYYS